VRSLFQNSMRIAAGIAVLMVAVYFIRTEVRKTTPQEIVDTYDDPKLAFEETKKALMMISKGFGKAEEGAKKINLLNEATEEIQRSDSDSAEL
jgi:NAD(P)H-hydrate repair Nnr-like enzyme with NAD(P)H-hydrate dehydratase domain